MTLVMLQEEVVTERLARTDHDQAELSVISKLASERTSQFHEGEATYE